MGLTTNDTFLLAVAVRLTVMHDTATPKFDREELTHMQDHDLAAAAYEEARRGEQGTAFDVMVERQKEMHDRLLRIEQDEDSFPMNRRQRDALRTRAVLLLHTTTKTIEMAEEHGYEQ